MPRWAVDWFLYLGCAGLTTFGLIGIKRVAGHPAFEPALWLADPLADPLTNLLAHLPLLAGLAGFILVYILGLGLWAVAMGRNELSVAYPIGISLSLVSSTLGAVLALGESVSMVKIGGIIAIMVGAVCLTRAQSKPEGT